MNKENRLIEEEKEMKTYMTTFPVEVFAEASIIVEAVSEEEAMIKLDAMNHEDMCEEMFNVVGGYVSGIPRGWDVAARYNMEEE